ncbi:hypothetical protein KDI99_gp02 [Arthrobacter phage Greenhouse]|uniref:Minor tail protein n=1 Tax=Arthrobacter phage Greenhouse TaxID=1897428 RepID=A0A1I9SE28_9CAUD|nr:hypothetical protein KDI99_gp02 [Arthrobacter phage Greenhouse]AOZ65105.1 hypothetical protein SEA_GREENHOUSE_2 [Arthrobacter phage Greenhouse]
MARTPTDPTKAQVWIDNTDPLNPKFEFYFPRGAKGETGGIVNPTNIGAGYDWNNLVVSGTYYASGADLAGQPNSPPSMAIGVNIIVQARNAAIVTQYANTVSNAHSQIIFQRSLVSGVWGPWKVFRNTNIDNGAGKVVTLWDETANRSQLIFGDTGWRDVSSLLINGWTASQIYLRRYGDRVTLKMYNVDGAAAAGVPSILNLPLGFRPPHGTSTFPVYTQSTTISTVSVSNGGTVNAPGGVTKYGAASFTEVTFSTIDSWPGALPGAAVGSIPNI